MTGDPLGQKTAERFLSELLSNYPHGLEKERAETAYVELQELAVQWAIFELWRRRESRIAGLSEADSILWAAVK
jgi:hypothetical protein